MNGLRLSAYRGNGTRSWSPPQFDRGPTTGRRASARYRPASPARRPRSSRPVSIRAAFRSWKCPESAVGLAGTLGDMDHGAAEQLDQPVDRLGIARSDIEALAADRRARRRQKRLRDVGHVDEIAALGAVADDGVGLARELLAKEHAEHRAVDPGGAHARAVGI